MPAAGMTGRRHHQMVKTEPFDMDTFFDFNQGTHNPSPITASSASPFDKEERQQFSGPSHDYGQYKQQLGLPVGSINNMPVNSNAIYDGFNNSGIDDMGFNSGFGWNTGLDMDGDMGMDFNAPQSMPPNFVSTAKDVSSDYINPNNVSGHEEPTSNVGRLWPGMHSQQAQQAAIQKAAQAAAVQQRQTKIQAHQNQQSQYRQASQSQGSSQQSQNGPKRASHVTEPHVEESISRLLNQMRQNSSAASDDADSPSNVLPHIARMKKDEEEMDEDERLLASDEGKKLSSKERRQLRNKVSARAFRSRRKEYISQLEGEVAMKNQESNDLRQENQALLQENERYRGLIETLLRHPAFTPFIDDISKNPNALLPPQAPPTQPQQSVTPTPQPVASQPQQLAQAQTQQDMKPEFLNFDASQLQIPPQTQPDHQQVGMTMVPDNDFSKLNINGFNAVNFNDFSSSVNAYAVTEVPAPDVVDLLVDWPTTLPFTSSTTAITGPSTTFTDSQLTLLLAKLDSAARKVDHNSSAV